MDRRGFIRTTFLGGVGTACATQGGAGKTELPLDVDQLESKLAKLDRSMARISSRASREWFLAQRDEVEQRDPEACKDMLEDATLVQASLRSALLVSSVAELPEANRNDPQVLERMTAHADEADFAVFGALARFKALRPDQLADLDRAWAAEPELGREVTEEIDALAAKFGVSRSRRLHLRKLSDHLSWRLGRERFSTVLRDTITKVEDSIDMLIRQLGPEPALVGGDPKWIEQTRAVIARHEPAAEEPVAVPTAEPPVAEPPIAESPPAEPPPAMVPAEDYQRQQQQLEALRAEQAYAAHQQRAKAEAKLEKSERVRNITLGVGLGLLVLGGAAQAGWAFGMWGLAIAGAVALTAGVILLIISIVYAVRVRKQRADLASG